MAYIEEDEDDKSIVCQERANALNPRNLKALLAACSIYANEGRSVVLLFNVR
jgi:hypothetical protein